MKLSDLINLAQLGLACAHQLDSETLAETLPNASPEECEALAQLADEIHDPEEIHALLADGLANEQMDILRSVLNINEESDADDVLYTRVHNHCRQALDEGKVSLAVAPMPIDYALIEELVEAGYYHPHRACGGWALPRS